MRISLRQLRYLVAVAETGSISKGAREVLISQSALSEAIQDLEAELGCKLLERSGKGMMPTFKGYQFLRRAKKILADVADAKSSLRDDAEQIVGQVQLGVTPLVAGYMLPDLLAQFRKAYPHIRISVVEDNREYLEHLLIGGELDAAVIVMPVHSRTQLSFASEIVETSRYRLWLPLGHPLSAMPVVSLSALAQEPQIVFTVDEIDEAPKSAWQELRIRPPVAFRTASVEAVRSFVATGAGFAILPDITFRPWSLEGDKIEARPILEPLPAVSVGIIWRKGSTISDAASRFLLIAQDYKPIRE